jgi:hypothetical protein
MREALGSIPAPKKTKKKKKKKGKRHFKFYFPFSVFKIQCILYTACLNLDYWHFKCSVASHGYHTEQGRSRGINTEEILEKI